MPLKNILGVIFVLFFSTILLFFKYFVQQTHNFLVNIKTFFYFISKCQFSKMLIDFHTYNINKFFFLILNSSYFHIQCRFERKLKSYLIIYQMFDFNLSSGYCTKTSEFLVTETFLLKSHASICSCSP